MSPRSFSRRFSGAVLTRAWRCLSLQSPSRRLSEDPCRGSVGVGVSGCVEVRIDGAHRNRILTNTGTDNDSERGIGVSTCGAAAPYALAFFPAASSSHWQGFARIINHAPVSGTVSIEGFDDAGVRYGPFILAIDAQEAKHFNSGELEEMLDDGTGDWRLHLKSTLDIEVLACRSGCVEPMSERLQRTAARRCGCPGHGLAQENTPTTPSGQERNTERSSSTAVLRCSIRLRARHGRTRAIVWRRRTWGRR